MRFLSRLLLALALALGAGQGLSLPPEVPACGCCDTPSEPCPCAPAAPAPAHRAPCAAPSPAPAAVEEVASAKAQDVRAPEARPWTEAAWAALLDARERQVGGPRGRDPDLGRHLARLRLLRI